jgi:hypothetical protein
MKTIIIKTQEEMDALSGSFSEFTEIEIRSKVIIVVHGSWGNSRVVARENSTVEARGNSTVEAWENSTVEAWENSTVEARENSRVVAWGNSRVVAWGNSRVVAWGNSRVVAWGNSRVDMFFLSTLFVHSSLVVIKSLRDNSRAIYKTKNGKRPEIQDATAAIVEFEEITTPTFEQWLERGYVVADGINQKLVSQKTIGGVTIFETTDFFEKERAFVAKIGNKFAHGKTIEQAKNDLRYKLSDRDTSKYKSWKSDEEKGTDELIEAYMTITGACSFGTKQFCEQIKLKDSYKISEIFDLTSGHYGSQQFKEFFQ